MPYFRNQHILFIHIPKTGGTTITNYFKKNNKLELFTTKQIFSNTKNKILPEPYDLISLQHQTYNTLFKYQKLLNITFNDKLQIISCVRNPYTRIISDLLFLGFIKKTNCKLFVFNIIKKYLKKTNLDNHNIPQYKFLIDENNNLIQNLKLFKLENLDEDLNKFGIMQNNKNIPNYDRVYLSYLNKNSIDLINNVYKKDFELFNYNMY